MRTLALLAIATVACCATAAAAASPQLAGYVTAPVQYVPLNKMVMPVQINGHPANLLIDTGTSQTILDTEAAQLCNVAANQFGGRRYIAYKDVQGQLLPIAFVRSLSAGGFNLGSTQVLLLKTNARTGFRANDSARIYGVLGSDMLLRHGAAIDCANKRIYFKTDRSRAGFTAPPGFSRVALRREDNGRFSVPCSIHGQTGRLYVDTGAFVTTFKEDLLRSLGISLEPAHVSGRFSDGISRQYNMGQVNDFAIGDFNVRPAKFGAAAVPKFPSEPTDARIAGILGMDLLYDYHAIIDFGSMNLFLK